MLAINDGSHVKGFDYGSVNKEDSDFLKSCVSNIRGLYKQTLENVVSIGRHLLLAKERLSYGTFQVWVESEFGDIMDYTTAVNAMNVAKEWDRNPKFRQAMAKIPLKSLYVICRSRVPEEARQRAYEAAEKGVNLTPADIREIRDIYRSVNVITSGVSSDLVDLLVTTAIADSPQQLRELSHLPVEKQIQVAGVLVDGRASDVTTALKQLRVAKKAETIDVATTEVVDTSASEVNMADVPEPAIGKKIKGTWQAGLSSLSETGVLANLIFAECPMRYSWLDEGMNQFVSMCNSLLAEGGFLMAVMGHKAIMEVGSHLGSLEPLHVLVLRRQPGATRSVVGINIACASVLVALAYKKPYRAPDRMLVDLQTVETGIEEGLEQFFKSLIQPNDTLVHVRCTKDHFQIEEPVTKMAINLGCSQVYTVGG